MSLYKTALKNRITDFANMSNRLSRQVCFTELGQATDDGTELPYQESLIGSLDTDGHLHKKLEDAPYEVRRVLTLMAQADPHLLAAASQTWSDKGKRKDGGNQFLCQMLGYDPRRVDLVQLVRDYLEEDDGICDEDYDD